jgi:hypothetical protein
MFVLMAVVMMARWQQSYCGLAGRAYLVLENAAASGPVDVHFSLQVRHGLKR